MPVAYLALTLLTLVLLLPTALRPPPEPPSTSAEFSPDAPPDDQVHDDIISSLSRGSSATAGALPEAEGTVGSGPSTPETRLPRACPRGFGNPPRQTFSLYSAPCAQAWQGDNGGATSKGVTGSEVRVALIRPSKGTAYEGPVPLTQQPGENATERYYRVMQQYFNQNFQFWGRQLRLVVATGGTNSSADRQSAINNAVAADEEYNAFGVNTSQGPAIQESIRRRLVVGGIFENSADYMGENQPYAFGWRMNGTQLVEFGAELLCKQFVGRPATFTDDPSIVGRERVFGLIWNEQFFVGIDDGVIHEALDRRCGERYVETVGYSYYSDQNAQNIATAVARMRTAGVTTIECFCDFLAMQTFTPAATQQGYFPEWFMPGSGLMETNDNGGTYDQVQWGNAFGLTPWETPRPAPEQDYYRAYKEVDPANTPSDANGLGAGLFYDLLLWANGIQMAGPNLTPETFIDGLRRVPHREPDPPWSVGGGFGPGDFTYADYVSLVWWDPNATRPEDGSDGAYRYLDGSERYALGEIPAEQRDWFREGVTQVSGR